MEERELGCMYYERVSMVHFEGKALTPGLQALIIDELGLDWSADVGVCLCIGPKPHSLAGGGVHART